MDMTGTKSINRDVPSLLLARYLLRSCLAFSILVSKPAVVGVITDNYPFTNKFLLVKTRSKGIMQRFFENSEQLRTEFKLPGRGLIAT